MRLKISLPTYCKDRYDYLEATGHLEVEGDADNLSEGYNELKLQIDALLEQVNAENRLTDSVSKLNHQISEKEEELRGLVIKIERANTHYESLKTLLKSVGVDINMSRLTFDNELLLESASTPAVTPEVVEHDPIPFNSGESSQPHEF